MLGTDHISVGIDMILFHKHDSFFLPNFVDLNSYIVFHDLVTMTENFYYRYGS